jgi:hypothetical protein
MYFLFCRTDSVRDLIFCLILYTVNYGRVGKCIMRKSKRYEPEKGTVCVGSLWMVVEERKRKKKADDHLFLVASARGKDSNATQMEALDAEGEYSKALELGSLDPEMHALILEALPNVFLFVARHVCRLWRALITPATSDGALSVAGRPPPADACLRWSAVCKELASRGWRRCAVWAHSAGHPWDAWDRIDGERVISTRGGDTHAMLWSHMRCIDADVHPSGAPVPDGRTFAFGWFMRPESRVELVSRLRDSNRDAFDKHRNRIFRVAQCLGDEAVLRWMRREGVPWQDDFWHDLVAAGRMDLVRDIMAEARGERLCGGFGPRAEDEATWSEWSKKFGDYRCAPHWLTPADSSACDAAAQRGDVGTIAELRAKGFPWTGDEVAYASSEGHLDVARWLLDNGAPWATVWKHLPAEGDDSSWDEATGTGDKLWGIVPVRARAWKAFVASGDFGLMDRALAESERIAGMAGGTCEWAARVGRLDVLRWTRVRTDGPWTWDEAACAAAASRGRFEALRWLREEGCPWDHRTLVGAIQAGRADIFRWAVAEGCPFHVAAGGGGETAGSDEEGVDEDDDLAGEGSGADWSDGEGDTGDSPAQAESRAIAAQRKSEAESQRERCSRYEPAKKSGHSEVHFWERNSGRDMRPVDVMLCAAVRRGYHGLVRHLLHARGAAWSGATTEHACRGSDPSVLRHAPPEFAGRVEWMKAAMMADNPAAVEWVIARGGGREDEEEDDAMWRAAAEIPRLSVLAWLVRSRPAPPSVDTQLGVWKSLHSYASGLVAHGDPFMRSGCVEAMDVLRARGWETGGLC